MSVITVQDLELETKLDLVPTLLLLATAGSSNDNTIGALENSIYCFS